MQTGTDWNIICSVKLQTVWCLVVLLLLTCPAALPADGKVVRDLTVYEVSRKYPDIPGQKALIRFRDNLETLVIETSFEGTGDRFGWIIPVPGVPESLERVSPGLMKTLAAQTQPLIAHHRNPQKLFHWVLIAFVFCLAFTIEPRVGKYLLITGLILLILAMFAGLWVPLKMGAPTSGAQFGGPSQQVEPGTTVVQHEMIGNYEVYTLETKSAEDLNEWLTTNSYQELDEEDIAIVEDYIENGWLFVAAKLISGQDGVLKPHPIAVSFITDEPVYPMMLTRSSVTTLDLDLYMIADKRLEPDNSHLKVRYCNSFKSSEVPQDQKRALFFDSRGMIGRYWKGRFSEEYMQLIFPGDRENGTDTRRVWISDRYRIERLPVGRIYGGRAKTLAHHDSGTFLWEGCVVTKLSGTLTRDSITADIHFKQVDFEPFMEVKYTKSLAEALSWKNAATAVWLCFPLLIIFRFTSYHSLERSLLVNIAHPLEGAVTI